MPDIDERLDSILAEYFQQLDQGAAVSPETLIESHPDLADSLREFFDAASFVERLAGPTQAEQTQMQSVHDTARNSLVGETIVSSIQQAPKRASAKDGNVPKHFGRYEIVRLLGQGAMGAVYLAYDPSLQRQIALKIPKFSDETSPDMSERFLREARSAAQLRHANICPVYEVNRVDGVHYLTMAYIEGRTLAEELRAGRTFQPREIATIVRKLALALGKAHGAGVVHRDLKPGNIMLDPDGEPILMDFGLAYREETDELRLTKTGMIVGSPAYMSPEQIEGDPERIGPASDIYSLGVVLYEMITGKLPFQGTMMSVIGQIASKEPTPVGHWRKDLADSPLERLCKKMLAKRPQERPASMQDVAAALDYVLSGLPGVRGQESGIGSRESGVGNREGEAPAEPPVRISPSPDSRPLIPESRFASPPVGLPVKFPEAVLAQERRDRAKMFLATTLILAALLGLFGTLAGVVYVATDQGTLEITSHVDDVQIEIRTESGSVRVVDVPSGSSIERLRSGDYSIRVVGDRTNVLLSNNAFKIKRGDKVAVTATLIPRAATDPRTTTVDPPSTTEQPVTAAQRATLPGPQPIFRLTDYASSVRAIAFEADGQHFATAGFDNTIRRRQLADGREVGRIGADRHSPYRAAFTADGRLVTAGLDSTVRLWDLARGREVLQTTAHAKPVAALAIEPEGKTSLTGSWDGVLYRWDFGRTPDPQAVGESAGTVWDLDVTADGKQAAVADFRGPVTLWNLEAKEPPFVLGKHAGGALAVAYVGGGKQLLSAGRDGAIRLWDVPGQKLLREHSFPGVWIESLGVSPDGKYALVGLSAPDQVPTVDPTAGQCVAWDLQAWQAAARLHTGLPCIYAAEFSPDGSLIFTGGGKHGHTDGGAVSAWRLDDALKQSVTEPPQRKLAPVLQKRFTGHEEYVMAVALARGGKLLASGGADRSVMLWNTESGERLAFLRLHDEDVRSIAFTDDTNQFLTASNDHKIRIWDTDRHGLVRTLTGHRGPVTSLAILPDGERAVSGSDDKTLRLWDLNKPNAPLSIAAFHTGRVSCLALGPDGATLASGGQDNQVIISQVDQDKLEIKHRLKGHTGEIRSLAFWQGKNNELFVFSASRDGTVRMWRADEGKHFRTNDPAIGMAYSVAVSPNGQLLAVGGGDWTKGSIKILDLQTSQVLAVISDFKGFVHALAFTDDSRTLAAGSADKTVSLWRLDEAATGSPAGGNPTDIAEVLQFPGHAEHVSSLAVMRDGQTIVSGSADGLVMARDIEPRVTRRALAGHARNRAVAVDVSRDGSLIVSGDWDGKLRLGHSKDGLKELDAHRGGVMSVQLSADATKVLTAGCDNTVKLWNAQTGELQKTLEGHTGWVSDAVFAEGGSLIVTTSFDQTIRVWNVETGKEIGQLPTHGGTAHALAASPDGKTVAAGMRDGYVRLYGVKDRSELVSLIGHADRVRDLVFTPDGKHLVSGSYDRTMRMWNVESGAEVAKVSHEKHLFNALAIAPDGRHVFSAGGIWKPDEETNEWTPENDYAIRLWRLPENISPGAQVLEIKTAERLFTGTKSHGFSVAASADGAQALVGHHVGGLTLWDIASGQQIREFAGPEKAVHRVLFWPDGEHVAAASEDGTIRLWSRETAAEVRQFKGHTGRVDCLALSRDGSLLLSAAADYGQDRDQTIRLWNAATGEEVRRFGEVVKYTRELAFSRDASRAYGTGVGLTSVIEWEVATGAPVHRFRECPTAPISLDVSPDGRWLATGHFAKEHQGGPWNDPENAVVRIWDLTDRSLKHELKGHAGPVGDVAFTPDGRFLLSAATGEHTADNRFLESSDQTVRLWDVSTGREVARYLTQERVIQFALCPDGKSFMTVGNSIRLWPLPESAWPEAE